ncbi:MAG: NERD domain-containing protein, partial [Acholeplasma sp.]|nr:NERD domain-containing protein [Acholeplasma sp.]
MAIMYPKNIELYDATLSERKIFKALQNQLPDTYTVFYAVQWVDSINGQKKESESDFLIFSESEGFLTCEVKGGKGYKKVDNRFVLIEGDGERRLSRSPMEQAEESSRYFYKLYMQEYNEQFNGIYGSISLFPFYPVNDPVLLDHRPKEVVFDIQDVENLNLKIRKAFLFYKSKRHIYGSLSKNQRNNFKNMINKNIASKASAGSIIEAKEFEINIVNRIQDNLVFFLRNHSRSFISGGAGTGKTWIAYKFAKKAPLEGKKTLLTTFNNQLIKMFKKLLNGYKNIDVISFDNLIIKD